MQKRRISRIMEKKDIDRQDTWELDQLVQEEEGVQEECLRNKEEICVE